MLQAAWAAAGGGIAFRLPPVDVTRASGSAGLAGQVTDGRWSGRRKLEEEGVTGKMLGNVGCRKCHIHVGSDFTSTWVVILEENHSKGPKGSGERNQQTWKRYLVIN